MTKYTTWDEYLASEQDAYLVPDNPADCDVELHYGDLTVYGKTDIYAYEICKEHEDYYELVYILTDADKHDLFDTLKSLGYYAPIEADILDGEDMVLVFGLAFNKGE